MQCVFMSLLTGDKSSFCNLFALCLFHLCVSSVCKQVETKLKVMDVRVEGEVRQCSTMPSFLIETCVISVAL